MTKDNFNKLRNELSIKAKNGIDFITAAIFMWIMISFLWSLNYSPYQKSIGTFIISSLMFPFAFFLSKMFKTNWNIKENPIQPLGIWLNVTQLFYFPFLIFILLKMPDYFVMTYAIITGAHFFPYCWLYKEVSYAVIGGVIAFGALFIGLSIGNQTPYLIPLFTAASLIVLGLLLNRSYLLKKENSIRKQR